MKIRRHFPCGETDESYEPISQLPDVTIPDESYTPRQLLARFAAGTMPPVELIGEYDDDDDVLRDPETDIVDVYNALQGYKALASKRDEPEPIPESSSDEPPKD